MTDATYRQELNRPSLLLFIAFCLLLPNIHVAGLASQVVAPRALFLSLYSALFILILLQLKSLRLNTFFILTFCFFVFHCIALIWSSDLSAGLDATLNLYTFVFAAYAFYQIESPQQRKILLNSLIASVALACLIGILQNFGWDPQAIFQARPPSSTFLNRNLASSASLLFLPAAFAQLFLSGRQSHKALFALAATLILSYILITHTKGVWLAGIGIAIIALISALKSGDKAWLRGRILAHRSYIIIVLLISLALFLAPGIRNSKTTDIEFSSVLSKSTSVRLDFYRDALPLIADNPILGIGSGSLRREFRAEPGGDYAKQHAEGHKYLARLHSDPLQYLVEQGTVGLALCLAMLVALFQSAKAYLRRKTTTQEARLFQFALLMGICGMLIHSLISFPLRSVSTGSLFWVMLGLALSQHGGGRGEYRLGKAGLRQSLLAGALLIVSVFSTYHFTNRLIGAYLTKLASDGLVSGSCFSAMLYLKQALSITDMDLRTAQLLAFTFDHCGGSAKAASAEMDQILAFEPNHSLALLVKGDLALKLDDYETALELYSHAAKVNPLEQRAYLGMAQAQRAQGNTETAVKIVRQLLQTDSENQRARELLQEYERDSLERTD